MRLGCLAGFRRLESLVFLRGSFECLEESKFHLRAENYCGTVLDAPLDKYNNKPNKLVRLHGFSLDLLSLCPAYRLRTIILGECLIKIAIPKI